MNFRAKHWPEGVFAREGGGGLIICPPTCTGSWCNTKKNLYNIFVISLSAMIYMYS